MVLSARQQSVIEATVDCLLVVMPPAEVERWFHLRHRRLDGCRPCDLIRAGNAERVLELARALRNHRQRHHAGPAEKARSRPR